MKVVCREITYRFPGAEQKLFDRLSFELQEPGFHALFGPSGVGKTTLARALTGDLKDYDGTLAIDGVETALYTYNLERLPGWSSALQHLVRVVKPSHHELLHELIARFGLSQCIEQRFSQLSMGQKNRVNLIRYLLQDFQMLVMDESLANVDERIRETILLTIKNLFPDHLFLYISHNVVEVSTFCRQIVVLRDVSHQPQVTTVLGQDRQKGQPTDRTALEHVMLGVMGAV